MDKLQLFTLSMQLKSTKQTPSSRKSQLRQKMLKINQKKLDLSSKTRFCFPENNSRDLPINPLTDVQSRQQDDGYCLQFDKKTARR